jgi:hypothetical protein
MEWRIPTLPATVPGTTDIPIEEVVLMLVLSEYATPTDEVETRQRKFELPGGTAAA